MFSPKKIEDLYKSLSSLYKNPTRDLAELAAVNVIDALIDRQQELLGLFLEGKNELKVVNSALYYKILGLLFEIDDYRGTESQVESLIVSEGDELLKEIKKVARVRGEFLTPAKGNFREGSGAPTGQVRREEFTSVFSRSHWKARVICCVATVESRRRESPNRKFGHAISLSDLDSDLELLENFVNDYLHLKEQKLYAWTTLAFVHAAQARIARQSHDYRTAEQKLLEAIECLDGRAEEIRVQAQRELSLPAEDKNVIKPTPVIEDLKDDLVSIRRKQTLISFFNVALVAIQRGFLRTANRACQSARLQFRLHGHYYHTLFNDLIILSIKRARTSRHHIEKFRGLKEKLENEIIFNVRPGAGPAAKGNRKLYVYALRELALLQSYCDEIGPMLETLDLMEKHAQTLGSQWKSRVYHQRARASWLQGLKQNDAALFQRGLEHCHEAFKAASGRKKKIDSYRSADTLIKALTSSKRTNLIETIESLITYGSIQVSARNFEPAIKTAEAIIQFCDEDNPRLLAMGYLVRAEAYVEIDRVIDAKQDVAAARILQRRIDHKYVADRMRAIEKRWLRREDYLPLEDLREDPQLWKKAKRRLLGWAIDNRSGKESAAKIATSLGVGPRTMREYLQGLKHDQSDPYHHLADILLKTENIREGIQKAKNEKLAKEQPVDDETDDEL